MSSDADWQRERMAENAAGGGRHWGDPERPHVRSQSKALRSIEHERALVDVLCRQRCVARVLARTAPGDFEVAMEVIGAIDGRAALLHSEGYSGPGRSLTLIQLGSAPVVVGCRCGLKIHRLDAEKLRAEAWRGRRGKPHVVGVSDVLAVH